VLFSFNFELQQFLGSVEALLWSSVSETLARLVPLTFTARTVATSAKCSRRPLIGSQNTEFEPSAETVFREQTLKIRVN
jgi:hypothetical protein